YRSANQNVVLGSLSVFGEDIEVAIFIENAGIDQLELRRTQSSSAILVDQPAVRIFGLRVFVERLHVRMRGRRVEVVIEFLPVLAVVAFRSSETEKSLL